jgi:uncharacterized protein YkwD
MQSTPLRRVAGLVAGLGLVTGSLTLAVVPAQAASFGVSVSASGTSVVVCEGVNLTGKVSPRPASHTVYVQQLLAGDTTWHTVAKLATTSSGAYRTTVYADAPGDRSYRVYKPRSGARKAGYSAAVPVHVTAQTGDVTLCSASSGLAGGARITVTGAGLALATSVTFTPQVPADQLAPGFTALPAVPATFEVTGDTLTVTVPPNLGGTSVVTVTTPARSFQADFRYRSTWRSPTSYESKVLSEINKRRATSRTCRTGTRTTRMKATHPVRWDGRLSDLALSHSRDLAARQDVYDGLSHVTWGTKAFSSRFELAGVTGGYGEVLALSAAGSTASRVVDQWIRSTSGHCELVMSSHWTRAGVGRADGFWQNTNGPQDSIFSNVDFQ